jgi:hypothetical protein
MCIYLMGRVPLKDRGVLICLEIDLNSSSNARRLTEMFALLDNVMLLYPGSNSRRLSKGNESGVITVLVRSSLKRYLALLTLAYLLL